MNNLRTSERNIQQPKTTNTSQGGPKQPKQPKTTETSQNNPKQPKTMWTTQKMLTQFAAKNNLKKPSNVAQPKTNETSYNNLQQSKTTWNNLKPIATNGNNFVHFEKLFQKTIT